MDSLNPLIQKYFQSFEMNHKGFCFSSSFQPFLIIFFLISTGAFSDLTQSPMQPVELPQHSEITPRMQTMNRDNFVYWLFVYLFL